MKKITSKKYSLNWSDALRGLLMAALTSALVMIQQALENWAETGIFNVSNYKAIMMAAIGGAIGYLIKNYFTPSKVVAPNE